MMTENELRALIDEPVEAGNYQVVKLTQQDSRFPVVLDLTDGITWQWVIMQIGGSILSRTVNEIVSRLLGLGVDYDALFRAAIRAIATLVQQAIDAAFLREYMADTLAVRNNLVTYAETEDVTVLENARNDISRLVPRIEAYGYEALGGFMSAASLYLTVSQAYSERNQRYRTTLIRQLNEFADTGSRLADQVMQRARSNVSSGCSGGCTQGQGSVPTTRCDFLFTYDWGERSRSFNRERFGVDIEGLRRETLGACEEVRGRYLIQRVFAASFELAAIRATIEDWRNAAARG